MITKVDMILDYQTYRNLGYANHGVKVRMAKAYLSSFKWLGNVQVDVMSLRQN